MTCHEKRERAERALRACEAELERLLAHHESLRRELEAYTRALTLLRARARALSSREHQEATA